MARFDFGVLARAMFLPVALSLPNAQSREPTTDTSIGVFYLPGAPGETNLWRDGDEGSRLYLEGRVLTRDSTPVAGALVEMWHADAFGGVDESRYRTAQLSGDDGTFRIKTVLPGHIARAVNYPVFAPRHIHVVVTLDEHEQLVSLIYFKGDERLSMGTPHPDLAIVLERTDDREDKTGEVLFGRVELVLRDRGE